MILCSLGHIVSDRLGVSLVWNPNQEVNLQGVRLLLRPRERRLRDLEVVGEVEGLQALQDVGGGHVW